MCTKEYILEKVWPDNTPEYCKDNPNTCPRIKSKYKFRCFKKSYVLDFIYENNFKDYNFKKFKTDDDIV